MKKVQLIQLQLDAFCDEVVEQRVIDEFPTEERARDYLVKRGFTFSDVHQQWIQGNCIQFPMLIQEKEEYGLGDIRAFQKIVA